MAWPLIAWPLMALLMRNVFMPWTICQILAPSTNDQGGVGESSKDSSGEREVPDERTVVTLSTPVTVGKTVIFSETSVLVQLLERARDTVRRQRAIIQRLDKKVRRRGRSESFLEYGEPRDIELKRRELQQMEESLSKERERVAEEARKCEEAQAALQAEQIKLNRAMEQRQSSPNTSTNDTSSTNLLPQESKTTEVHASVHDGVPLQKSSPSKPDVNKGSNPENDQGSDRDRYPSRWGYCMGWFHAMINIDRKKALSDEFDTNQERPLNGSGSNPVKPDRNSDALYKIGREAGYLFSWPLLCKKYNVGASEKDLLLTAKLWALKDWKSVSDRDLVGEFRFWEGVTDGRKKSEAILRQKLESGELKPLRNANASRGRKRKQAEAGLTAPPPKILARR